ncbi:MAG: DUF459 domain-containing protein [Devosia sp.]
MLVRVLGAGLAVILLGLTPIPALAGPAKVAFVGDSMADGIWGAFFRMTGKQKCSPDELVLVRDGRNGTGLARPDHFDWTAELDKIVAADAPAMVVASVGLNDRQDLIMPDKTKYKLGSAEWLSQYTQNVADFYAHASSGGAPVVIIGLPNLRDAKAEKHALFINGIYEEVAETTRNVTYLEPWRMTNDDGSFASFGPDLGGSTVQIRAPDGLHFTAAGYDVLGKYLEVPLSKALAKAGVSLGDGCLGQ